KEHRIKFVGIDPVDLEAGIPVARIRLLSGKATVYKHTCNTSNFQGSACREKPCHQFLPPIVVSEKLVRVGPCKRMDAFRKPLGNRTELQRHDNLYVVLFVHKSSGILAIA